MSLKSSSVCLLSAVCTAKHCTVCTLKRQNIFHICTLYIYDKHMMFEEICLGLSLFF